MPAGGIWTIQDKIRPGTYINVLSSETATATFGSRGTVAVALPMNWGPTGELIELLASDLQNGKSLPKIGCTMFDLEESLPYRLALSGCSKALVFRADDGGLPASVDLEDLVITAEARHFGTFGNSIKVVTENDTPSAGKTTVSILIADKVKESFEVTTAAPDELEAIVSQYVDFLVDETAAAVPSGTFALAGGTNGTVSDTVYEAFFTKLTSKQWQALAIQSSAVTVPPLVETYIRHMREDLGKKVQGVVYNDVSANYEGIISVKQGFKTSLDTVSVDLFPVWVASLTAGARIDQSNTAYNISAATEIINPIDEDEIAAQIQAGWFLLSYRQDGAVCVETDINTLSEYTPDKGYVFSKNRVIRCLDGISNLVAYRFNSNYAGKVDNNTMGRNLLKSEIIANMDYLQDIGAIQNFQSEDVIVLPGEAIDGVVVDIAIQPVDSMEKLYVTINLTN